MSIKERLDEVNARIRRAATEAGVDPESIILVGASKTNDASRVREAIAAGLKVCGENRVQEMLEKEGQGAYEGAELHFIGHLQKNKVKNVVGLASLIHSVDSLSLMDEIEKQAAKLSLVQDVLLEINIGREEAKSGFFAEDLPAALEKVSSLPHIRVRGLMAVPPICANGEENRPYFLAMKQLFIDNMGKKYDNVYMDFMSMGMSGDFETAIACGANMIRLGSVIFGARDYSRN
ncbi:MAG: YggS family pyridoxal phosphate-dependent enzyme [Oscillospiraceae bacterium]|nr:YggS family pyridoxal phosphate-dependent enzyme [Oscillospiraceae bacterium]